MNKLLSFIFITFLMLFGGCEQNDMPNIGGDTFGPTELYGCEGANVYDWDSIEFQTSLDQYETTWIAFVLEETTLFNVVIDQAGFHCLIFNGCDGELGSGTPEYNFESIGNGQEVGILTEGQYYMEITNTRNRVDFIFSIALNEIVYGCMNDDAINYNESANVNDGSCQFNDCNTDWYVENYGNMILDCNGNCSPDVWVGDGWCDNGGYLIYPDEEAYNNAQACYDMYEEEEELVACFSQYVNWIDLWCVDLNWDGGDCDEIDYGCPEGQIEDCNGNCAPDSWLGDGYCDDGAYQFNEVDIFFNCETFNNDGGDCDANFNRQQNQQPKYPNGRETIRK